MRLMGAPAADPVAAHPRAAPAAPGPGRAGRDQPELSPVPEAIDTGFASIDSKQKASQLFNLPARVSEGGVEGGKPADVLPADPPRRKKKVEGSLTPRVQPPEGPFLGADHSAPAPTALPRPEGLPQPAAPDSTGSGAFPSAVVQEVPFSGVPASGGEAGQPAALPPPLASEQPEGPIGESHAAMPQPERSHAGLDTSPLPGAETGMGDTTAAGKPFEVPILSMPAQGSHEAAPLPPYLPAFGSVIAPAPDNTFWQGTAEAAMADPSHEAQLQAAFPQTSDGDGPFGAPAGTIADSDFWASAGAHEGPVLQQYEPLIAPQPPAEEQQPAHQQSEQQYPEPPQQSNVPSSLLSAVMTGAGGTSQHGLGALPEPESERLAKKSHTEQQPTPAPQAAGIQLFQSTGEISSSRPQAQPQLEHGGIAEARQAGGMEESLQGAEEQPFTASAPAEAYSMSGGPTGDSEAHLDPFASPFPSGQDEDTSFFEGLGSPGS